MVRNSRKSKIAHLSWLAFKRNFPTKQNYVLEQKAQEEQAKHSTDINELLEIIQSGNVELMHHIFCRNFDTHDTLMTLCDAFEQKVPAQVQRDVLNKNMDSPLHQSVVAEFWKRGLHRDVVITFSDLPPEIISDILNTTNREDIFMVLSKKHAPKRIGLPFSISTEIQKHLTMIGFLYTN